VENVTNFNLLKTNKEEIMGDEDLGKTSTGMEPNVAALLCYLGGFVTGIIFYMLEKENKFVRFHAMQSIVTFGFIFVLMMVLGYIPVIGWVLIPFVSIGSFILWIILMIKSYKGEYIKLPIAGNIAEQNS